MTRYVACAVWILSVCAVYSAVRGSDGGRTLGKEGSRHFRVRRHDPSRPMTPQEMLHTVVQLIANATNSEHVSTVVEKTNSFSRDTAVKNATYDYSFLHKDWNGTQEEKLFRHGEDRKDICARCQCASDLTKVLCELNTQEGDSSLTLHKALIPKEATYIKIRGYKAVTIKPKTFSPEENQLSAIIFEDIGQLNLYRESFDIPENARNNTELTIKFINCSIPSFPTGMIAQKIKGGHEDQARHNLKRKQFLSIYIQRCRIDTIEEEAITRSRLIYLDISQTKIKKIHHRGLDLQVYELSLFKENSFPPLHKEALCLHAKDVIFKNNYFEEIASHSIVIETDGQVLFESNIIKYLREEALLGIHPRTMYGVGVVIHANTIFDAEPRSLFLSPQIPAVQRRISNNSFSIQCNCTIRGHFHSLVDHEGRSSFNIFLRSAYCVRPYTMEYATVASFLEKDCTPFPTVVVASVVAAFFFFLVAIGVCVGCSLRMQRMRDEAKALGECTSQSFSTLNRQWPKVGVEVPPPCGSPTYGTPPLSPLWIQPGGVALPFALAVPEVKTYKQSEVNEFTEVTESIKGSRGDALDLLGRKDAQIVNRGSCPFN